MRRIQRDIEHEQLVKRLTTGEGAIFPEIWRLLLFAAALGVKQGIRRPLGKVDSGKSMPESYFGSPGWRGFLYLVSLVESDSSACLASSPEQQDFLVSVFEEYANQGLHALGEALQTGGAILEVVTGLLLEAGREPVAAPDLSGLI